MNTTTAETEKFAGMRRQIGDAASPEKTNRKKKLALSSIQIGARRDTDWYTDAERAREERAERWG